MALDVGVCCNDICISFAVLASLAASLSAPRAVAAANSSTVAWIHESTVVGDLVSSYHSIAGISTRTPLTSSRPPLPSVTTYPLSSHPSTSKLSFLPTPSSIPPPISTITPSHSLPPPPTSSTADMVVDPIIYLVGVPLVLGVLLGIAVILVCCLFIHFHLRKRKQRSRRSKRKSSVGRMDQPKSLKAYAGDGPSSVGKMDESTMRYELQTVDTTNKTGVTNAISTTAAHHSRSSRTLPVKAKLNLATSSSSSPQISSLPRDSHLSGDYPVSMESFHTHTVQSNTTTMSPHRARTSSLRQQGNPRLYGIPEHSAQVVTTADEKYVVMVPAKAASLAALPQSHNAGNNTDRLDPRSLYDVPSSVPANSQSMLAGISEGPLGMYDVPKSALIASGHYKVPPLALGLPDGVYDVPPSASSLYDLPPDVYDLALQVSDLYDVPPSSGTRPRQTSEPTSQRELIEACRSPGSDNVFRSYDVPQQILMTSQQQHEQLVPDYSHYDIPKHLMMAYREENGQSPAHAKPLSRSNSSPNHSALYDVPRRAILADSNINLPGPPTAPKPSRKGRAPSRSRSDSSSVGLASPEHKPHPNAVFYDIAPLDTEFFAWKESKPLTSDEFDASDLTKTRQHDQHTPTRSKTVSPMRTCSVPANKKKKVPPPTRSKPVKMNTETTVSTS